MADTHAQPLPAAVCSPSMKFALPGTDMTHPLPTTALVDAPRDDGVQVSHFLLPAHDWVPNHPRFPVLLYRAAIDPVTPDLAEAFETRLAANGWPAQWRDGVFDYHHYHSTAHEALAVFGGRAELILGGPGGISLSVAAGDLLVLPAGTGHCRRAASDDFQVVGAYPRGQDLDICQAAPTAAQRASIYAVPVPAGDPLEGEAGWLSVLWRA
jgi:uncharacterized protein YjlB